MTGRVKVAANTKAPDWTNQSFRERMFTCRVQLLMYGMLTEKEGNLLLKRLKKLFGDK